MLDRKFRWQIVRSKPKFYEIIWVGGLGIITMKNKDKANHSSKIKKKKIMNHQSCCVLVLKYIER